MKQSALDATPPKKQSLYDRCLRRLTSIITLVVISQPLWVFGITPKAVQAEGANACGAITNPLTPEEQQYARIAWQYFVNNYQKDTGFVNSTGGYPSGTLWDMGNYLMALNAVRWMGIIDQKEFDNRLNKFLTTLGNLKLIENSLPNKVYNAANAQMTDYGNKPIDKGIGWSALDIARLLAAFRGIQTCNPQYTNWIKSVVDRWALKRTIKNGQLFGAVVMPDGKLMEVQEGRLGYEEYAARCFELWGFSAPKALSFEPFQMVNIYGVPVPADTRSYQDTNANNYVVSESYLLDGIEFGFLGNQMQDYAARVFEVQKRRFEATGQLTAVSEDNIDGPPYFLYNTIFSNGAAWATITEKNELNPAKRTISTKAAFGWRYIYPQSDYAKKLFEVAKSLIKPDKGGFYAGLYEETKLPNKSMTGNTNGLIIEILYYKARGSQPLVATKGISASSGKPQAKIAMKGFPAPAGAKPYGEDSVEPASSAQKSVEVPRPKPEKSSGSQKSTKASSSSKFSSVKGTDTPQSSKGGSAVSETRRAEKQAQQEQQQEEDRQKREERKRERDARKKEEEGRRNAEKVRKQELQAKKQEEALKIKHAEEIKKIQEDGKKRLSALSTALPLGSSAVDTAEIKILPVPSVGALDKSSQFHNVKRSLKMAEKRYAEAAWQYFKTNYDPNTGLVSDRGDMKGATLWGIGDYLEALQAAEALDIITLKDFDERVRLLLGALKKMPLFAGELPHRGYDIRTLTPVDYGMNPTTVGTGWSGLDIGRVLVAFHNLKGNHPEYTSTVDKIVLDWSFLRAIRDGRVHSATVEKDQSGRLVTRVKPDPRLGYEEYAARGYQLWGFEVDEAAVGGKYATQEVEGVQVPVERERERKRPDVRQITVSNPFIQYGLELGLDPQMRSLVTPMLEAQARRYKNKGILTASGTTLSRQAPYVINSTISTKEKSWDTLADDGTDISKNRMISTAAAFAYYALFPNDDYAKELYQSTVDLYNPSLGFYDGVNEKTGLTSNLATAETNSLVLQSILFQLRGHQPLLADDTSRSSPWWKALEKGEIGTGLPIDAKPQLQFVKTVSGSYWNSSKGNLSPDAATSKSARSQ
jgi:Protein of unknown function (DUF3131)